VPSTSSLHPTTATEHAAQHRRDFIFAALAALFLLLLWALAFWPGETSRADALTLGVLGVVAVLLCWTPLARHLELQENAATFALTAAMFIVYALARRVGPSDGWALTFPWLALPDDRFVVPYAARLVVLGALLTAPLWWRNLQSWTRALLGAAALLLALAAIGFRLLASFYAVGPVEQLDPSPLPYLGMQIVEYSCLALLCNAATAHPTVRRWALRALPILLLALWARLQLFAPAATTPEGDAE
jgi:hypothetical protein